MYSDLTRKFWYFGKVVAQERWSQGEVRLYLVFAAHIRFHFKMQLFTCELINWPSVCTYNVSVENRTLQKRKR